MSTYRGIYRQSGPYGRHRRRRHRKRHGRSVEMKLKKPFYLLTVVICITHTLKTKLNRKLELVPIRTLLCFSNGITYAHADWGCRFNGWGVTVFDSLSTMWIMGLKKEFNAALSLVANSTFIALDVSSITRSFTRGTNAYTPDRPSSILRNHHPLPRESPIRLRVHSKPNIPDKSRRPWKETFTRVRCV